jgi:hypothetical protein
MTDQAVLDTQTHDPVLLDLDGWGFTIVRHAAQRIKSFSCELCVQGEPSFQSWMSSLAYLDLI